MSQLRSVLLGEVPETSFSSRNQFFQRFSQQTQFGTNLRALQRLYVAAHTTAVEQSSL